MTPENEMGIAIAEEAHKYLAKNKMMNELKAVGTNGTASIAGRFNVIIR